MTTWKRLIAFAVLAAVSSTASAQSGSQTMTHAAKERTFALHVPATLPDGPAPLIVAMHFYPGSGSQLEALTGLSKLADTEGFIVAYPDGLNGGFDAIQCCGNEDDVGFIKAMVEKIATEHAIDEKRVFATGISNGGDMAYKLAAKAPGLFAAIAPVSGGMNGDWMQMKQTNLPTEPTSLIYFYGRKDRYHLMFAISAKFWLDKLGCAAATSTPMPKVELTKGDCTDGSVAEVYALEDMGHSWPGAAGKELAFDPSPVDATRMMWDFFKAHPKK